jgi:anti-sigma factor RsiW
MTCKKIKRRLSAFIDDEIDIDERQLIAAHLKACPACETERQKLLSVHAHLADEIRLHADPFLLTKVKTRVETNQSRLSHISALAQKAFVPATILAGLCIGVLLGLQIYNLMPAPAQSATSTQAIPRYSYIDPNIYEPIPSGSITATYMSLHSTP